MSAPVLSLTDQEQADELRSIITDYSNNSDRSQQRVIGPSELGNPCQRFLAYKALDFDPVPTQRDNWLADLGTAMHERLAKAVALRNEKLGRERYLIEQRVELTGAIGGSVDLYDTDYEAVIDHKLLGVTSYKAIRAGRIPGKYRAQIHSYGYGYTKAGRKVRHAKLAVYPRSDNLRGDFMGTPLMIKSEEYSERVALWALDRYAYVCLTVEQLDVWNKPENLMQIPIAEDPDCQFCPFFRPGNAAADATGCPGKPGASIREMPGKVQAFKPTTS